MSGLRAIAELLIRRGFLVVFIIVFLFFSVVARHFFELENLLNIFSAMAPLAITAAGLALVVMSGRLDISIGSIAFLSCAIGALLVRASGLNPVLAAVIVVGCGALLGAVNAFIVVVLRVNSLIATLSTMIAFRGIALQLTDALLVQLPPDIRFIGNTRLGPIPVDILVMLFIVVPVHLLQNRTVFGRRIMAMGNDIAVARRLGLPVDLTGFISFVLSGVLASLGGILTTIQNGAVSPFLGSGWEFTALAAIVVGGISLLGGRGTIFFGVLPGVFIFEMIRNGLTNLGANPYSYRLVANADPARQAANIDDLITRGVDIIMARAFDSGAIGTSIKSAEKAGIPFITFDRGSTSGKPTAHVGGDSYDQAKQTAEAFAGVLKKAGIHGSCIELQGMLTDINAVNRSKAWNDVAKETGQYTTIVQVPTNWNPELFLSGLTNALNAHPEANCVFAASDFAFPSIQAALEKAGRWAPTGQPKHMWLATCDLLTAAVKPMEEGYIDISTTWDAYLQAKEAVRVIIAIAKREDPGCGPDGCLAKGRVVTPATVKTIANLWSRDYNK